MTAWRQCPALLSENHPDLPRLRDGLSHGCRTFGAGGGAAGAVRLFTGATRTWGGLFNTRRLLEPGEAIGDVPPAAFEGR